MKSTGPLPSEYVANGLKGVKNDHGSAAIGAFGYQAQHRRRVVPAVGQLVFVVWAATTSTPACVD